LPHARKPSAVETDGDRVSGFIESFCRLTKGSSAGDLISLREWQKDILNELFVLREDGRRKYRRGLIGLPRKNGKSLLGAGIALFGLFDEVGAEVYCVAGDRLQAKIVFGEAKRMVELDEELSRHLRVYRDAIEYTKSGSVLRALSSDSKRQEGLNPSLVVFDEVHVQPDDALWSTMNLGSGARANPLVVGITTAGSRTDSRGGDTLAYRLWQYGRKLQSGEVEDATFYFRWFAALEESSPFDEESWKVANPAYGDFLDPEDFKSAVKSTPEAEFKTKRMNLWVSSATSWLPHGAWDACRSERRLVDGEEIVLGFDGSFSGDSTALIACTLDGFIDVVGLWERPTDDPHWRVDTLEVEEAIRQACKKYAVKEITVDPARWQRTLAILEAETLPVVEFPQSAARMTPATAAFYDAVTDNRLTHSGNPALARHVGNASVKIDSMGPRLKKEHRASPRKIDAAVAAVIAFARAQALANEVQEAKPMVKFWSPVDV
jgi:phage terminase large subunit-like protein